ncbi:MAG: hypothetical protein ACTSXZ_10970 [Alphaproteobacteria bacterium]
MKLLTPKNLQRMFTVFVLLTVVVVTTVFSLNYTLLQRPLNRVIEQDARNRGLRLSVYYDSYIDTDTIVFDVRGVGQPAGNAGLFRAFFQFARELQGREIETVVISYRGSHKLKIKGDDFLELGASFGTMPPNDLMWQLARNLRLLNGKLVLSHIPGNYAAILRQNLGDGASEGQAAAALLSTITQ